jgi:hypothetical protein
MAVRPARARRRARRASGRRADRAGHWPRPAAPGACPAASAFGRESRGPCPRRETAPPRRRSSPPGTSRQHGSACRSRIHVGSGFCVNGKHFAGQRQRNPLPSQVSSPGTYFVPRCCRLADESSFDRSRKQSAPVPDFPPGHGETGSRPGFSLVSHGMGSEACYWGWRPEEVAPGRTSRRSSRRRPKSCPRSKSAASDGIPCHGADGPRGERFQDRSAPTRQIRPGAWTGRSAEPPRSGRIQHDQPWLLLLMIRTARPTQSRRRCHAPRLNACILPRFGGCHLYPLPPTSSARAQAPAPPPPAVRCQPSGRA